MNFKTVPLCPGMLNDAAFRLARDLASGLHGADADPIATMGWASVLVPEALGGAGGSLHDLAAIVEGIAPHALHLPVIERCAVVPTLLMSPGAEAPDADESRTARTASATDRWLQLIATGEARVGALIDMARGVGGAPLEATRSSDGLRVSGTARGVIPYREATHWLALANVRSDGDGAAEPALLMIDAGQLVPASRRCASMDGGETQEHVLVDLSIAKDRCLSIGEPVRAAVRRADDAALLLSGCDAVSAMGALIEQTGAYLNGRIQFGVALSSFQVLRHRLVDVYVRYESVRGMLAKALRMTTPDPGDRRRDLKLMKLALGEAGRFAAESAIQLHGGMGMSEEVLAARLARRLVGNEFKFGDRLTHSAALSARPAGAWA